MTTHADWRLFTPVRVRFDAIKGRSKEEKLLDAAHRAVLSAFKVPQRDRYQIYQEHPQGQLIVQDTDLGIERTSKAVVVTMVGMPRSEELKLRSYAELCRELKDCHELGAGLEFWRRGRSVHHRRTLNGAARKI